MASPAQLWPTADRNNELSFSPVCPLKMMPPTKKTPKVYTGFDMELLEHSSLIQLMEPGLTYR